MDAAQTLAREHAGADRYPVSFLPPRTDEINRWWGIPLVGVWVRAILLIPHAIVQSILAFCMFLVMFVGWIPILLFGRVPGIQQSLIKEIIHRGARMNSYLQLFPGGYPGLEPGRPGPVHVVFDLEGRRISRWWGIPFFGAFARMMAAIPHFFVLWVLSACCGLLFLVVWIPILLDGRYPHWAMTLFEGTLRYAARVLAYTLLLPVPYPPFSLDD